jgi:hypothetical protein
MYTNFNRLPGSMIIKGNYLIILTNTSEQYCQTFQKNVNNMKVTEFVATGRFTNDGLQHGLGKNCGEALNVNKANGTVRVTVIPLK